MIKVTLIAEHIHQRVKRVEGDVIEVADHLFDWLARHGVIETRPQGKGKAAKAAPADTDHDTDTAAG